MPPAVDQAKGFLTKRLGPLPVWGWGVAVGGAWLIVSRTGLLGGGGAEEEAPVEDEGVLEEFDVTGTDEPPLIVVTPPAPADVSVTLPGGATKKKKARCKPGKVWNAKKKKCVPRKGAPRKAGFASLAPSSVGTPPPTVTFVPAGPGSAVESTYG